MDYARKEKNKFKISNVQSHRVNINIFNIITIILYYIIIEKFIKYNQTAFTFPKFYK